MYALDPSLTIAHALVTVNRRSSSVAFVPSPGKWFESVFVSAFSANGSQIIHLLLQFLCLQLDISDNSLDFCSGSWLFLFYPEFLAIREFCFAICEFFFCLGFLLVYNNKFRNRFKHPFGFSNLMQCTKIA